MLGDLSVDQLNATLEDLKQLLDAVDQAGRVGGMTEQFGVSQTITVAQASQILAYMSTANVWAQATAENTGALVELTAQLVAQRLGEAVVPLSSSPRVLGDTAASRSLDLGNNRIA
jgi:exo-beta-1,3-glucanase (GH17 family)